MAKKKLQQVEEDIFHEEREEKPDVPDSFLETDFLQVDQEYYESIKWKGIKDVFRCMECGHCLDEEDDMILHVVGHRPEAERETLMNMLILKKKEMK